VLVTDDLAVSAPKTKELKGKLDELGFVAGLILVEGFDANLWLAARNLPNVMVEEAQFGDPVALVGADKVVASAAALKIIEERLK
jgi:large subunit ribosomal protein L4